ncbi:DNA polymerase [Ectothiorhodospira magna]|uniref:Type-4 uracil-DNA glycosylase n=1 Tax=Ectothiorhodospira magna TaxID=867345 RepID=A0A1H9FAX0_9GAMM|nr:uracil-DNA glycosylase [Ectothiorhodospira magna]SEQ35076.1 DNA polymerase [Ectothiorhodospira magna]
MDEGLRRRYLEVMGIQQWVPRDDTPTLTAGVSHHDEAPAVRASAVMEPDVPSMAPAQEDRPATTLPAPKTSSPVETVPDWETLSHQVETCTRCAELASSRTRTVFGVGDRQAPWLFIGEAPGAEEDRRGEPFVGRAGKLLDNMLAALGLARGEGVYIANILKCRPPDNRDPKPEEAGACRDFLDQQIALIQPRIIVALGRVAAQNLLATKTPLGALRGHLLEYRTIPLVVTYHPAYLLRKPLDKRKAWDDLCLARQVMRCVPPSGSPTTAARIVT